ncbi:MAG: NifB/NifX family molybdenum-iron cluster-binding protein [Candidatus Hydrogenedentes bacterium]|nr:NifB/NifX family molybdenum-iron cluster-binding protein [Candidatus Hydrogenedentota bacterium]
MKIIVSASGNSPDALVDPRFGRAAWFILIDSETGAFQAHENTQNLNAAQGAGIQAAQTVSRLGADIVITGHCGPKAFKTLSAAGVKVFLSADGSVTEAVEAFKSGTLVPADAPDVEGHWA